MAPRDICEFYDVLYFTKDFIYETNLNTFKNIYMDDIVKYLTNRRSIWNQRPDIGLPTNFNQVIIFPVVKMWM